MKCSGDIHKLRTSISTLYSEYKRHKPKCALDMWNLLKCTLFAMNVWNVITEKCVECGSLHGYILELRLSSEPDLRFSGVSVTDSGRTTAPKNGTDPKVAIMDDVQHLVRDDENHTSFKNGTKINCPNFGTPRA